MTSLPFVRNTLLRTLLNSIAKGASQPVSEGTSPSCGHWPLNNVSRSSRLSFLGDSLDGGGMVLKTARCCLALISIGLPCLFPNTASAQSLALVYELNLSNQARASPSVTSDPYSLGQTLAPHVVASESRIIYCRAFVGTARMPARNTRGHKRSMWAANDQSLAMDRIPANNFNLEPRSFLSSSDVTLWLGPRYRLRSSPDTFESQRFMDTRYETWAQSNASNSVGLQLLFPFH